MGITDTDLTQLIEAIRQNSTYDFRDYSDKSLKRRFEKILVDYKSTKDVMIRNIRSDKAYVEQLVKDITVNTTELFRDPPMWHTLRTDILPQLAKKLTINIWHAGCSTGQEVYSMIILLNEMGLLQKARIYATDINTDVIQMAEKGEYRYRFNLGYLENFDKVIRIDPNNPLLMRDIPYEKYFSIDKAKDTIQINKELLSIPKFHKHNLVSDGNIFHVKFDLILCRNVIIYFNYALQNNIFKLFHESLNTNAFFVLGFHESILGPFASKFEKRRYCYLKK